MTKKPLISIDLYAPRWNVLKVNIEHHHRLIERVKSDDEIRYHKRAIFQQLEELKRYDFMWDRTASSEEKQEIIKLLK